MLHYMDRAAQLAGVIGGRVRQKRLAQGWTLDELADASAVSRRMLVNIEQGVANPSIGILLKLCEALGVGLPALVEPSGETALKVTRSGAGPVLWSSEAGGQAVLVAGTEPPDVVELWDWTLGPGDSYTSAGHTGGTRELLQVQDGAVSVEVDGQAVTLDTGDALSFPGDVPHGYGNAGAGQARFSLSVFEPAADRARRRVAQRA